MTTDQVLALARKHIGGAMESSARLCMADAIALHDAGNIPAALRRAVDSLRFSVGVFHQDFKRAQRAAQ
jgi:hypothetical protein